MKPENPYKYYSYTDASTIFAIQSNDRKRCWQEGFDAAIAWLKEPCTKHPYKVLRTKVECNEHGCSAWNETEDGFYQHRYLCPECRKEVGL